MLVMSLYVISGLFLGLEVELLILWIVVVILYLIVFGLFIGFFCYFYILKYMWVSLVVLVMMVMSVLVISLGVYFNGEVVIFNLVIGVFLICVCLLLFYWGDKLVVWVAAVDICFVNLEK